jgi:hypothetical protein
MGYMESHDEERLMYKNEQYGNSSGSYNIKNIPTGLKRMEEAGAFFFTIPGPKMIWMFGELGYDYSIDYNGRTGEKPIRWDYYQDANRKHLYGIWSALIHLKETEPVFNTTNYNIYLDNITKRIQLNDTSMDATILGNFDVKQQSMIPYFQHTGWWYEYFTGDSIQVSNTRTEITLAPGEYRLYTSKRLKRPDFILGVPQNEQNSLRETISVFPNPASSEIDVKWNMEKPSTGEISLYDLTGRQVRVFFKGDFKRGVSHLRFGLNGLNRGLYFMVMNAGKTRLVKKLMIR